MLYHRLHCHMDSSRLVGFGKGLGGCLNRGLLQLLSKASSPALGHHKREAHCFETLRRGRAKSHGTRYWLKGRLLMQRGTAGIQTPDSPESAALFKAREAAEESQPCADRELAALPNTWMPQHLPRCRGLVALRSSAPLPLPRILGKLQTPRPRGRLSQSSQTFPVRCGAADPAQRRRRGRGQRGTSGATLPRPLPAGLPLPHRPDPALDRLPGHSPSGEQVEQRAGLRHGPAVVSRGGAAAEGAGGALRAEVPGVAHTAPLALPLETNEQLLPKPPNRPPNLNKPDFVLQVGEPR